jgi:hypothetical protein
LNEPGEDQTLLRSQYGPFGKKCNTGLFE